MYLGDWVFGTSLSMHVPERFGGLNSCLVRLCASVCLLRGLVDQKISHKLTHSREMFRSETSMFAGQDIPNDAIVWMLLMHEMSDRMRGRG